MDRSFLFISTALLNDGLNCVDDAHVSRAAAQIASQCVLDLGLAWVGVAV
jgi:hypothetical protein